jgi:transposase
VTLQLLWEDYAAQHGAVAYRRSAFCQIYRDWEKQLKRSMRQRHFAGEKLFVDYAGRTAPIYGCGDAEAFRAYLFVSDLGKSRVELSVLLVYRWILARLRQQRFFSLDELNTAIRALLTDLIDRPYQRLPGTRRSVFEALDRPTMRALPSTPYELAEWKEVTVACDYHLDIDGHFYSVPHALVGHGAWARFTAAGVEVFFRSERVSSHSRSYQRGQHTTLAEHMPKSHRAHAEWSPERLIQWGVSIGAATGAVVEHLLRSKPHPEQGYRACLGLLSLSREYGEARLEAASALAHRTPGP